MFETSRANLDLFDQEPILTFIERLIGDDRPAFGADHGHAGPQQFLPYPSISGWHQDELPYYVLPALLVTCTIT